MPYCLLSSPIESAIGDLVGHNLQLFLISVSGDAAGHSAGRTITSCAAARVEDILRLLVGCNFRLGFCKVES